jgi:hypothetical protein
LRFDELVRPILDAKCVRCHWADSEDWLAAETDLTIGKGYAALLDYAQGDLRTLAFEKDRSFAGECPAANSQLWQLLTSGKGHHGVVLDAAERERLATWMDTYAHQTGSFSAEQEEQLRELRKELTPLLSRVSAE